MSKLVRQWLLGIRISGEDLLGLLVRVEELELEGDQAAVGKLLDRLARLRPVVSRLAILWLKWSGKIVTEAGRYRLTRAGREAAQSLLRSHRLWESYIAKHFVGAEQYLHDSATRAEHFIDADLQEQLAAHLDRPATDPHGRTIPPEASGGD